MSNYVAIRANAKPGDIILLRQHDSPVSIFRNGAIRGYWTDALLYIGNEQVLDHTIQPLLSYFNGEYCLGLFRVTPKLPDKKLDKISKSVCKSLMIRGNFIQRCLWYIYKVLKGKAVLTENRVKCTLAIAIAYRKMGIQFKQLPPYKIDPMDFDESPLTVRIA